MFRFNNLSSLLKLFSTLYVDVKEPARNFFPGLLVRCWKFPPHSSLKTVVSCLSLRITLRELFSAIPLAARLENKLEVRGFEPLTYSLQSYRSTN